MRSKTTSRRIRTAVAVLGAAAVIATATPAPATHCHQGNVASCPAPLTAWALEGVGFVCSEAKGVPSPRCTYSTDAFMPQLPPTIAQGLYWPGRGPAARGPFSFVAGPSLSVPSSLCVSSVEGAGCTFDAKGSLFPGDGGFGAYCGSSLGQGTTTFRSASGALRMNATFGWAQSAATILPLVGDVTSSAPSGAAGSTLLGFFSSRGVSGGGNCGVTQATTQFQVEGFVITF